ncbi:metallophosphoesterase [Candidatus Pacearchaeota archaeon]|nr:metallophosphoesterase [Candidatus Pacearchaeota archaeon]
MESKEILKFCLENGLLVDNEILNLLSEEGDVDSIKLIIERIKSYTQGKIITKDLFYKNKENVSRVFLDLPEEKQRKLEKLKIKLGLSIEISKEVSLEENYPPIEVFPLGGDVKIASSNLRPGKKFGLDDFVKYFKSRFIELKGILQNRPELENLVSINKLSSNRQSVSLIGIVYDKKVTKNKNIIFEIEDLTGTIKVLINQNKEDLYKKAEEIPLDAIVAFKGSGDRNIVFCQDIFFPEVVLQERKKSPLEEYALFISDIHLGSRNFLEESFLKFIDYLNGSVPNTPEVSKIKYLFIVGDIVTGVGNYPDQERDLKILDLEEQFNYVAKILGRIRKDIKIIISPGNHEGVRLMEPQPLFDEKYAWALYDLENVILTENPTVVNIASTKDFSGFNVLTYHGFSYPYYANTVPSLMKIRAMNSPEKIMEYLLKFRHLAPEHGSVQYFPSEKDVHFIGEAPDIFVSGHTHKSGVTYYGNILVISGSSWESLTSYQEKFGNTPDHCKVPMINLKTREVKILDFE